MKTPYLMLRLTCTFGGMEQTLCPVVLRGAQDLVLVDCGYPGSLPQLEEQLGAHGVEPAALTKLVITHQDDDHFGAAAEFKEAYPSLQILASPIEAPYLSGMRKNLRLQQAEALQSQLPEEQKGWGEAFCGRFRALRPVPVDAMLSPGAVFDWGGGCEILATPGHTPGHISIRALDNSFCVTGDAAVLEEGRLAVANPGFCLNLEEAERSLAQIVRCRCRQYLCYHGGAFTAV